MSRTNVNLSTEVIETIHDWQTRGTAELWVEVLQKCLEYVACDCPGDSESRLKLVSELIYFQNEMRVFIVKEGGEQ